MGLHGYFRVCMRMSSSMVVRAPKRFYVSPLLRCPPSVHITSYSLLISSPSLLQILQDAGTAPKELGGDMQSDATEDDDSVISLRRGRSTS